MLSLPKDRHKYDLECFADVSYSGGRVEEIRGYQFNEELPLILDQSLSLPGFLAFISRRPEFLGKTADLKQLPIDPTVTHMTALEEDHAGTMQCIHHVGS